ncbi:MAG: FG-GAP repeat protein [Planctomycetes bacterium]|nr:FG-GAP repeat protein [Planctomycetota bacterium]
MRFRPAGVVVLLLSFASSAAAGDDPPTLADGRALLQKGDPVGAEAALVQVVQAHPDDAVAWMLLGFARHAQGHWESALVAHEKAAGFDATRATASYNAACANARLGRTEAAFDWLGRAVDAGFRDRGTMLGDADLQSLAADPRFADALPPQLRGSDAFVEQPRVLYELDGEAAGDQFGWIGRNVGDLDRDGVDDFVATAVSKTIDGVPNSGRIYAYSSRSGALLFTADGGPGEQFGDIVASLGDVDGDRVPDLLVGAPGSPPGAGHAYVLSGADGSRLRTLAAGESGDGYGTKGCGMPDLDGDGVGEIAVGAPTSSAAGAGAGRVYVHSGKTGALLQTLDGEPGASFGVALASCTDAGHEMLVVGAGSAGPRGTGKVYVERVVDGELVPHFSFEGGATARQLGQYFVSVLGDVDGDGVPDVFGSDFNDGAKGTHTGKVYVHSGRTGERLLELTGAAAGAGFGTSVSDVGDCDGDGHADLLVGSWRNSEGAPVGGKVTLFSGLDGSVLATYTCREPGDTFGFDATGLGDVDGDGARDFLCTSGWSAVHGTRTGRVFVIAGPVFGPAKEVSGSSR